MHTHPSEQIEAIHAMMASGHRSVRLERHTLILWGVAAAFLIVSVRLLFPPDRFEAIWQHTLFVNLYIATLLIAVGIWDFTLTRRARRERDESLSFTQLQLTKVWWLVIAIIVLINIGMNLFGGGYLFYPITIGLMGLAFYIHGLFSTRIVNWIGILLLLMGLGSIALQLHLLLMEWLAVSLFGIGFPLLAWAIHHPLLEDKGLRLALFSLVWLLSVIGPAVFLYELKRQGLTPQTAGIPLSEYMQHTATPLEGEQVVRLPAGTVVPIEVSFAGELLQESGRLKTSMTLAQDIEVSLIDGKPDGRYRIDSGPWIDRVYNYQQRLTRQRTLATLDPTIGPLLNIDIDLHNPK